VDVEQSGFKRATRENVEVTISGAVRVDFVMEVGEVSQSVEVQATAQLLRTENANISEVVPARAIEETPVNGRNLMALTTLTPGVISSGTTDGNAITGKNVFAAGNYQIGGGMANQGATFYDGVPNNSVLGNLVNMVPSPDVVSEFRVESNSNSAEYGRYSGGVINISSKSGTNQFHGAAYDYLQNDALTAQSYLFGAQAQPIPHLRFNNFGFALGGPILKKKLFFYFDYDQIVDHGNNTGRNSVPTTAIMGGDFTGMQTIYDPTTQTIAYDSKGNPYPVRQSFASEYGNGNAIPSTLIDSLAAKMQQFYPTPTNHIAGGSFVPATIGSEGEPQNNFYASLLQSTP
jgi:hypothetical protein